MCASSDEIEFEAEQYLLSQNPFDRVKRLYTINPITTRRYAESKQCKSVTLFASSVIGSIVFAVSAPVAKENYLRANTHAVHKTVWLARRRAGDAYVLGGLKKGGKWLILSAAAVSAFSHLSQAIELYRMKTSAANYAFSGALLGGASRIMLGARGMLAGAFIGGYFGVIAGYAVTSAMVYHNINVEKRLFEEVKKELQETRFLKEHSAKISQQLTAQESPSTSQTSKDNDISSTKNNSS